MSAASDGQSVYPVHHEDKTEYRTKQ